MSRPKEEKQKEPKAGKSELEELRRQIEDLQKEKDELFGKLQRVGADYENFQKRVPKQIADTIAYEKEKIIRTLLPVLDNFEHTLEKGADFADAAAVLDGVKIVYDHLLSVLVGHGITKIEIQRGEPFNPSLHEAILHEESDECEENTILRELAAGYMMNGRALRPAKVSVAKESTKEEEERMKDEG